MNDNITVILLNWMRTSNIENFILPTLLKEQYISSIIIAHCNPLTVFGLKNLELENEKTIKLGKIIHCGCFDMFKKYGTFCKWVLLNKLDKIEDISDIVMSHDDTFLFELGEIKILLNSHKNNKGILVSGVKGYNLKLHEYIEQRYGVEKCNMVSKENILGNKRIFCSAVEKILKLNLPSEFLKEEEILINMFCHENIKNIIYKNHFVHICKTSGLPYSNSVFEKNLDIKKKNSIMNYLLNLNRVKCFCYWDKGKDEMPEMIKYIFYHNKTISEIYHFEFILITDENVETYINLPPMFYNLEPNFKSDIVRFTCLNKFGGLWIDADVILIKDINILWKNFLSKKKDVMLDIELNNKIGCASMLMLPDTICSNFCYNHFNVLLESHDIKKNIKWDFLGPANVKLLYLTFPDHILLNSYEKVVKGCNFITWADKPGFIKDKWFLNNEFLSKNKAIDIINNKNCFYVITWTIYNKNDIENIIDMVFYNKQSVFHHLTTYREEKNEQINIDLNQQSNECVISNSIDNKKMENSLEEGIQNFNALILNINNNTMNETNEKYKYFFSIAAVFKQESHVLEEWILHYLQIGIDHFYLINDFSTDNYKEIIDKYSYYITLFNNDIVTDEFGRQMQIYEKYLNPILYETKYMAILDLDEFLYSPMNISFHDFFKKYNLYNHFTISWLNFGSNKHIDQPSEVISGFTKRAEIKNNDEINTWGFKSMFKTKHLKKFGIHKHECNGDTLILDSYSKEFVINHYIIQSLLFYLEVKCTRGSATNFMNCPNKVVVEQQRKTRARFNFIDNIANSVEDKRLLFQKKYIFQKKIIIFVPYCSIYENYIIKCLLSIENQTYSNYEVIIINDGNKNISNINEFIKNKKNYKLINFTENLGPAHSKWRFIEYMQTNINNYNYNDIAMILDGDDYLECNALFLINKTYVNKKCWTTYGNAEGKFCYHEQNEIPNKCENIRKFDWIYNHPRTCIIYLLTLFKEEDFKINERWLSKGTDRPFVYNCIEWAGREKTQYISNIIYQYVEHQQNSYKTIPYKEKQEQLKYLENITPKDKIIEDIHIVMCCWKRIEYLNLQMNNLNIQNVKNRIHIHLLNNNINNIKKLDEMVIELKKKYKINIHLSHYDNKYYGFQRFIYTKDVLIKKYNIDYVIFIDDDQLFYYDWIESLYNKREPNTFLCWYGRKWIDNMNYWSGSIINMTECRTNNNTNINEFDYGATCGCLIDVNIFNENTELWNIPNNLPKNVTIYNIEDLWLSYVIRYFYNWKIKRSFLPEKETINDIDSCNKHSLYLSLYEEKQQLFDYLNKRYIFYDNF